MLIKPFDSGFEKSSLEQQFPEPPPYDAPPPPAAVPTRKAPVASQSEELAASIQPSLSLEVAPYLPFFVQANAGATVMFPVPRLSEDQLRKQGFNIPDRTSYGQAPKSAKERIERHLKAGMLFHLLYDIGASIINGDESGLAFSDKAYQTAKERVNSALTYIGCSSVNEILTYSGSESISSLRSKIFEMYKNLPEYVQRNGSLLDTKNGLHAVFIIIVACHHISLAALQAINAIVGGVNLAMSRGRSEVKVDDYCEVRDDIASEVLSSYLRVRQPREELPFWMRGDIRFFSGNELPGQHRPQEEKMVEFLKTRPECIVIRSMREVDEAVETPKIPGSP